MAFYDQLKAECAARGVTPAQWARFVRWLRSPRHGVEPIAGRPTPVGRFVLRAWRREPRVPAARITAIAAAIAARLPGESETLNALTCWRGHDPGPRLAARNPPRRLATCRSTLDVLRYHLEEDPLGAAPRAASLDNLRRRYQRTSDDDQARELALWQRPLGRRAAPPAHCGATPHPSAFDLVWAFPWQAPFIGLDADALRDTLGLVRCLPGAELVAFHYAAGDAGEVGVPTAVEALGAWEYVPAATAAAQTTYDYRRLTPGAPESVHAAQVPPTRTRFAWVGRVTRRWDQ